MRGAGAPGTMAIATDITGALTPGVASDVRPGAGPRPPRDLRLDFFRGLALWFIFLDHIPDNVVSWVTVRNFGFSDATEIFVFISGYAAFVAYSGVLAERGWPMAAARIFRRVWQLYVAHIILFVAFTAQIAWVSLRTDRKPFLEEMNLLGLIEDPVQTIVEAALLNFRPANLDVLPLYIVLLAGFAFLLPAIRRVPWGVVAGALVLYLAARNFGWNFDRYPDGEGWFFDPFTWQLLFLLGAACAADGQVMARLRPVQPVLVPLAIGYLAFCAVVALSWKIRALSGIVPDWLGRLIYPIDKTTLDPLRIAHFLAIAYLVSLVVRADARFLRWRIAEPIRRCGEHSLAIFCIGTFLSFTGYVVVSGFDGALWAQVAVSAAGIAIMIAAAYVGSWYKRGDKSARTEPG